MLCPRGPALFGFVHRTFLEYLVARALLMRLRAQEISLDQLIAEHVIPHVEDENWHEIIPLLAALLGDDGPALAGKLIGALIPPTAEIRARPISLGLAFRAFAELDARQLPRLGDVIAGLTSGLRAWLILAADSSFIFDGASRLSGSMIAGALDAVGHDWPRREGLLGELGVETLENAAQWSFFHSVPEAVLGSVLGNLGQTRDLAIDGPTSTLRGLALAALARSHGGDPDIMRFLRDRAQNDPEPNTRALALWSLAQYAAGETDTIPFLRDRAHADEDGGTRGAGLLAWARAAGRRSDAVLVSRNLDAVMPSLDLSQPIDEDRVQRAAAELSLTPREVRARYEALAEEFPLRPGSPALFVQTGPCESCDPFETKGAPGVRSSLLPCHDQGGAQNQ